LVTIDELRKLWASADRVKLEVIGDLGCDIGGAVECTTRCTDPGNPVFVYDVTTDSTDFGFNGNGPAVLAVDILPSELPLEASQEFAKSLAPLLPRLARADLSRSFEELELPPELRRAVIVHRGRLTPDYAYLQEHLERSSAAG